MCAVYSTPLGPVNVQSNSTRTSASTSDGQLTSFGLNFVCFDTTSTTDFAAPSGLIFDPHPLTNMASTAAKTSNARRIAAVLQISGNATGIANRQRMRAALLQGCAGQCFREESDMAVAVGA